MKSSEYLQESVSLNLFSSFLWGSLLLESECDFYILLDIFQK